MVRAHPTVPHRQNPLWFQQRTDRPDLFARAKIQMALQMVALNRLPNGQFFSRKVIPVDVRDAYSRLYGGHWEAQLRQPADTPRPEPRGVSCRD